MGLLLIPIMACGKIQQQVDTSANEGIAKESTAGAVVSTSQIEETTERASEQSNAENETAEKSEDLSRPDNFVMENTVIYNQDGITVTVERLEVSTIGDSTLKVHVVNHNNDNKQFNIDMDGVGLNGLVTNAGTSGETRYNGGDEGDFSVEINFIDRQYGTNDPSMEISYEFPYQIAFKDIDKIMGTHYAELPIEVVNFYFAVEVGDDFCYYTVNVPTENYISGDLESMFNPEHLAGVVNQEYFGPQSTEVYQYCSDERINVLYKPTLADSQGNTCDITGFWTINGQDVMNPGYFYYTGSMDSGVDTFYFQSTDVKSIRQSLQIPNDTPIDLNMDDIHIATIGAAPSY